MWIGEAERGISLAKADGFGVEHSTFKLSLGQTGGGVHFILRRHGRNSHLPGVGEGSGEGSGGSVDICTKYTRYSLRGQNAGREENGDVGRVLHVYKAIKA